MTRGAPAAEQEPFAAGIPTAKELRGEVRHWRRSRADTSLLEVLGDAYIAVFATLMLGAMAVNLIVQARSATLAACPTTACEAARHLLPWWLPVVVLAATLSVARLFGPLLATPAVASWLLSTPVDRRALLRPQLAKAALFGGVATGAITGVIAATAGFTMPAAVLFAVTAAAAGVCVVAFAALVQVAGGRAGQVGGWLLWALVWATCLALTLDLVPLVANRPASVLGWAVAAAVAAALAVGLSVRVVGALHRAGRSRLVAGGTLLSSMSGALATLDLALVYDIVLARRWRARGRVRPVRSGPRGPWALVWRDLLRLRRAPQPLVVVAASVLVPYLAVTIGAGGAVVPLSTLTGFIAGLGLCAGLRVVSRTPGLSRSLGLSAATVRAASLAVPATVLVAWGLAVVPAVHTGMAIRWSDAVVVGLAVGGAAATAVTRWMTAAPPNYSQPLVSSPAGAIPSTLLISLARGFDVLVLLTVPLLLAAGATGAIISLALAAIVLGILLSR